MEPYELVNYVMEHVDSMHKTELQKQEIVIGIIKDLMEEFSIVGDQLLDE